MPRHSSLRTCVTPIAASMLALSSSLPAVAADPIPSYQFATPVFGIDTAPDGSLLVADAGAGIVELRRASPPCAPDCRVSAMSPRSAEAAAGRSPV